MKNSLVAGPWVRGAHSMAVAHRSGRPFAQEQAIILESAHYWRSSPVPGFDLDHIYTRYLAPENVEAWRRRAIALLDEQFASDGDEGVVLSFVERASLSKTRGYWCRRVSIDGRRYLQALERFEVRPAASR
jgi:hypothetical protein